MVFANTEQVYNAVPCSFPVCVQSIWTSPSPFDAVSHSHTGSSLSLVPLPEFLFSSSINSELNSRLFVMQLENQQIRLRQVVNNVDLCKLVCQSSFSLFIDVIIKMGFYRTFRAFHFSRRQSVFTSYITTAVPLFSYANADAMNQFL